MELSHPIGADPTAALSVTRATLAMSYSTVVAYENAWLPVSGVDYNLFVRVRNSTAKNQQLVVNLDACMSYFVIIKLCTT